MTKILGFQSGHDIAYCILEDGIPVLCEESERITRTKMEKGDGLKFFFSRNPDADTLNIQHFTFGNWGFRGRRRQQLLCGDKVAEAKMYEILAKSGGKFWEFGHHLSHASNAFFTSNFDRALVISMDAGGWEDENTKTCFTIHEGLGNKINLVKAFPYPEAILGEIWLEMVGLVFELSIGYPKGDQAGTVMSMATLGTPKYTDLIEDYIHNLEKLKALVKTSEQEKFNVAASLQKYSEIIFKNAIAPYLVDHENLCFSGGVALNCVMLGKVKEWFPHIKNIFCDPVPYDAGLALGSARYLWHHVLGNPRVKDQVKNMTPYMGKLYSREEIDNACKLHIDKITIQKTSDEEMLDKIYNQKIVAVYGGGSETGRRALGNRSILASPTNAGMKAQINARVKHRQWFRPISPSILEENVGEWFENPTPSPYMSFALKFKENKIAKVPAVVHYDGTGRLQTVNKELSPWYYKFLKKWEKKSGVPILINTSFNDSEPIVETPQDALSCFLKTDIDYLYFFDYRLLVEKIHA